MVNNGMEMRLEISYYYVSGGLLKLFSPWIGNVSDEDTFDDRFMWSVSDEGDLDDTKKFKSETNIQPLSNHNHHQIGIV